MVVKNLANISSSFNDNKLNTSERQTASKKSFDKSRLNAKTTQNRSIPYKKLAGVKTSGDQVEPNDWKVSNHLPELVSPVKIKSNELKFIDNQSESIPLQERARTAPKQLIQCVHCHRFYGTTSYAIHQTHCNIATDIRIKMEKARQYWELRCNQKPSHPPGCICYICGRRYTNSSFNIHLRNCLRQWSVWNALLPKARQVAEPPQSPKPTEEDIKKRIQNEHRKGNTDYTRLNALDDIMFEESQKNRLPLELIY